MTHTHLAHCQLGYRPRSPKILTLVPAKSAAVELPGRISFYLRGFFDLLPRDRFIPAGWKGNSHTWPFDLEAGKLKPDDGRILMRGELIRIESRWGAFWRGDFSEFSDVGNFQIETDYCSTYPIAIGDAVYERIQRGFLYNLHCQRSGFDVPGIRKAEHLDDGILDTTGQQIGAAGGWYDAGDLRKWLFLTLPNLGALATLAKKGLAGLRAAALDEIAWGNRFFHAMMSPDGQMWEDLAGGTVGAGLKIEHDWWYENHPGCTADGSGGRYTDNRLGTGDERPIRTTYNPAVQFLFIRTQCQVAKVLPAAEAAKCLRLAEKAWNYGRSRGHDGRTLFVAEELFAAIEAFDAGIPGINREVISELATALLERQEVGNIGLSGYFMEEGARDGFRCIALSCEPALALLRLLELAADGLEETSRKVRASIERFIDCYVLADAGSNPFGVGPYGVYVDPPRPDLQSYRDAGRGRGVRTFIHPFNPYQLVHGTGGVVMHQASLCSKAGRLFGRNDWTRAAEQMIQWLLGHNPEGLCLHTGIGFRHPTPFSAWVTQIPDSVCVGHIGRPDDTPYQESSPLLAWSTQEIWDIPHAHLCEASLWL